MYTHPSKHAIEAVNLGPSVSTQIRPFATAALFRPKNRRAAKSGTRASACDGHSSTIATIPTIPISTRACRRGPFVILGRRPWPRPWSPTAQSIFSSCRVTTAPTCSRELASSTNAPSINFSVRRATYPLTPPAVKPPTSCFCSAKKMNMTTTLARIEPAAK